MYPTVKSRTTNQKLLSNTTHLRFDLPTLTTANPIPQILTGSKKMPVAVILGVCFLMFFRGIGAIEFYDKQGS